MEICVHTNCLTLIQLQYVQAVVRTNNDLRIGYMKLFKRTAAL